MEMYILIFAGLIAVLLIVLIVLVLVNKSSSEASIRAFMMDSERAKRREMDEMKNQLQDDMNDLKDRMNHDLLVFQNSVLHSFREDLPRLIIASRIAS